ncbi:MAG: hypothetical protein ACK6AO_17590 [Planctomycetota bacterium]
MSRKPIHLSARRGFSSLGAIRKGGEQWQVLSKNPGVAVGNCDGMTLRGVDARLAWESCPRNPQSNSRIDSRNYRE